jgi:Domain of unknown function (DUF4421)
MPLRNKIYTVLLCLLCSYSLFAQDSISRKQLPREYFVQDISDKLNVSLFVLSNRNELGLAGDKGAKLNYSPNDYAAIGISVRLHWLGLAFSYAPKNLQENFKGSTTYTHLKLSSYGKKMGFDVYYLDYSGYFLNNTKEMLPSYPLKHYIRGDISTLNLGVNYYYLFNHKRYSYRSTFIQNEIQKHSAGSFMLSSSVNYYNVRADSSIVPKAIDLNKFSVEAKIRNGDFYNLCIMPGYGHTFVAYERFFLTLSLFAGIDFQQQHYTSELKTGNRVFDEFEIIPRAMGRTGIGYNSKRFFTGFTGVADVYNLPLGKNERISYNVGSVTFYVGFHFNLPKSVSKYTDKLKMFPNLNFQKSTY